MLEKQYQLFPELGDEEFAELKESIRSRGVLSPIEKDEQGNVLDGFHRLRAVEELRAEGMEIEVPVMTRVGMTHEQKVEHTLDMNLRRRHLTPQQRGEIVLKLRQEGWSGRRIAEKLGVTHVTVQNDLAGPIGKNLPLPERVQTSDGRSFPAKRPEPPRTLFGLDDSSGVDIFAQQRRRIEKEQEREAIREHNRQLVESDHAMPLEKLGRYPTLVLDPPWDWGDEGDVDQFGRARPTYATMPFEQIADLPVPDLAEHDSHIYLWITNRSLPKGFALLEKWGFRYVTALTWCKPSIGMGNYYRGSTEQVLFGVRGSLGLLRRDMGTWFAAPRPPRHSAKPDEFYSIVETCSPGPWLEMFARKERPGWATWGAEVWVA